MNDRHIKLICFANFTGGGLLCELFNKTRTPITGISFTANIQHSILKDGDNGRVYRNFNHEWWTAKLDRLNSPSLLYTTYNMWFGTHCHPSVITDDIFYRFDKVIAITTESVNSKYYRYLRWCHDSTLLKEWHPKTVAYNVLETFESESRCTNIEFEDIVNGTAFNGMDINLSRFEDWRKSNDFLYHPNPELRKIFDEVLQENEQQNKHNNFTIGEKNI